MKIGEKSKVDLEFSCNFYECYIFIGIKFDVRYIYGFSNFLIRMNIIASTYVGIASKVAVIKFKCIYILIGPFV